MTLVSKRATFYQQSEKPIERELAFALNPLCHTTRDPSVGSGIAVFYGVTAGYLDFFRQVVREKRPYVYIDNGYFNSKWHGGAHYRLTRNAPQHLGSGAYPTDRWRALGIELQPWRRTGSHVLVACQSEFWYVRHGTTMRTWCDYVRAKLALHTTRPIVFSYKPVKGAVGLPSKHGLAGCWAVVTHSSNVAVDAIVAGVPAITLNECAASAMSRPDIGFIENLHYPEDVVRYEWACNLAANQWTVNEIRDGMADHLFKEA